MSQILRITELLKNAQFIWLLVQRYNAANVIACSRVISINWAWCKFLWHTFWSRNQKLFRTGGFCSNCGTSINTHLKHEKERSRRAKRLLLFRHETLKKFILNEIFYPEMTTIRRFFLQIGLRFSSFRERSGEISHPLPPLSPVVTHQFLLIIELKVSE